MRLLRGLDVPARDALLPAGLLALGAVEFALSGLPQWGWGLLCYGIACALLVVRRRWPLVSGCLAIAVLTALPFVEPLLNEPASPIAIIVVAAYGFGRYRSDLWGIAGIVFMVLSSLPQYLYFDGTNDITDVVFVGALLVPPYVFGRVARKLDEQTRLLAEQQGVLQQQAVRAERDRIARELHDVIAHSVSAMVVQTAAAEDLVLTDPARARQVLAEVAATGRRALAETARLLHVIRDESDELGLEPVPGLADLDELAGGFEDYGLHIDLHKQGDFTGLPAGVDVSAYRIVQEVLTNASRHGAGPVDVSVERTNGSLRIIASNAVAADSHDHGGGLGLLGMAERASLLGGSLDHQTSGGRFELEAVFPVAAL